MSSPTHFPNAAPQEVIGAQIISVQLYSSVKFKDMASGKKSTKKTSRILVADDSITIQKLVNLTFAPTAFEVIAAADGHDALIKIRNLKPEVIFVAAELPQVDGFTICDTIRKDPALETMKVVILRTASQKDAPMKARTVGADDVLLKPFDAQLLLKTVDSLSKERTSMREEESTVTILAPAAPEKTSSGETVTEKMEPPRSAKESELKDRLEAIAAQIVSEKEPPPPSKRDTFVEHKNSPASASAAAAEMGADKLEALAKAQIQQWVEQNLPALAEKLLKAEIEKAISK